MPSVSMGSGGIVFSDSQTVTGASGASVSSEVFDHYEEGSWTPSYLGSSSNPTVSYQQYYGYYVRIGRVVICHGRLKTNSKSGGSGDLHLGGLPFNCIDNARGSNAVVFSDIGYFASSYPYGGYAVQGEAYVLMQKRSSFTGVMGSMATTDLGTGSGYNNIRFTITYQV